MPTTRHRRYGETREQEAAITTAKRRQLDRVDATGLAGFPCDARYVVLDMDNILCSLRQSRLLYERVQGATSGTDLRIDMAAFTTFMQANVPRSSCILYAVYTLTPLEIAMVFEDYGWSLTHTTRYQRE